MKFPVRFIEGFEDDQINFEFLEGSGIFWGSGAPTFVPDNSNVSYYFRSDTPGTANQRLYVFNGSTWTGIL